MGTGKPNHMTTQRISRDLAVSRHAMVAAKHPSAVEAALGILAQGGNAVDAAAAAAFAIGVVEPWMSGIGGVGFMTIHMASGERAVVDYFGRAPQAATADMYELTGESRSVVGFGGVKDEANAYGPLSCLVPGMVGGMATALERWGTKSLADVVAPAIQYAEEGFEVNWYNGMLLASQQRTLQRDAETSRIFLTNGGMAPAPLFGDANPRIRQPELAVTLRRIAQHGRDGFYTGETAEKIASHLQSLGGLMTTDDLARYEPTVVDPLIVTYHDHELVLIPYQGGGITLAESFNILDGLFIDGTGHNSSQTLHHITEASHRAFADRFAYVGDPDYVDIDWDRLGSAAYGIERRGEIDSMRASDTQPGSGIRREASVTASAQQMDGGCTTHLSVVDQHGNMVSVTQTLTLIFGSVVTVPGTGVLMNDSMNLFEPIPGRANSIAGWKRPASNMAHVIAAKDGVPVLAVGAPGGRRIIDTCLQMTLNVIDFGMDIQSSCAAPLVDCSGPELLADTRIPQHTRDRLRGMGHTVQDAEVSFAPRQFASPTGVTLDPATGLRYGGADPFGIGIAAGQ